VSGEISQTSMFMSRLAQLKQAKAAPSDGPFPARNAAAPATPAPPPSSEPVSIVVTSLNEKVLDLQKLLDGIGKNITALATSRDRADEAIGILEEAGGITVRARDTLKTAAGYEGNKDRIAELEKRFSGALEKLSHLVEGSSLNGINLLKGDTLSIALDNTGKNQLATTGIDLSPETLEFRNPDFKTASGVQDSRIDVMNALDIATTLRHVLSSDLMLLQTRQEFSLETISTLSEGAKAMPSQNIGDEAASLLALQLRQQLSENDLPLAGESQQFLLKQF